MRRLAALVLAALMIFGFGGCSSDAGGGGATQAPPADAPVGSLQNPHPLGAEITDDHFTLVVNSVNLDATDEILEFSGLNDPPEEGMVYILVNVTMTYVGDDPGGERPSADIRYIDVDGNQHRAYYPILFIPDEFDPDMKELKPGESTTGNFHMQAPADSADQGVLNIRLDYSDGRTHVAVK